MRFSGFNDKKRFKWNRRGLDSTMAGLQDIWGFKKTGSDRTLSFNEPGPGILSMLKQGTGGPTIHQVSNNIIYTIEVSVLVYLIARGESLDSNQVHKTISCAICTLLYPCFSFNCKNYELFGNISNKYPSQLRWKKRF